MAPSNRPTAASNAAAIEELRERLFGSGSPILALSATVTAGQVRNDERFAATDASIAAAVARITSLEGELNEFVRRGDIPAPVRHRKHTQLAAVIRDLRLRVAQLESMDHSAPNFVEAVNAEIVRLNSRIDQGYVDLEGRVTTVEGIVAGYGQRLDLIDPTLAAHTDEIVDLKKDVAGLKGDIVRVEALASAGVGVQRGRPRWGVGAIVAPVSAFVAGLIAYQWADLSAGWSWFTAGVVGVAGFWIGSSWETNAMSSARATAAASVTRRPVPDIAPPINPPANTQSIPVQTRVGS